jgi:proteic killer suppression protein
LIASYANSSTENVANSERVKKFDSIAQAARRKLEIIKAAVSLEDLKVPPGNRLEALAGDRKSQYSIRINDQYRICFLWKDPNAYEVEIVDYHA